MRQITARVCGNPARPLTLASCSSRQSAEPVVLSLTLPYINLPHLILSLNPSHLLLTPPSPLSTNQNRRSHRRAIFPHAAKDQWATFSGVLEVISGRSHLNWAGNLDSSSPSASSPLELPSRHLQLQSRLREHLYSWPLPTRKGCVISTPLARKFLPSLHLDTLGYHGMCVPGLAHLSTTSRFLTLDFLAVTFAFTQTFHLSFLSPTVLRHRRAFH